MHERTLSPFYELEIFTIKLMRRYIYVSYFIHEEKCSAFRRGETHFHAFQIVIFLNSLKLSYLIAKITHTIYN